jgi:hypothetical protein
MEVGRIISALEDSAAQDVPVSLIGSSFGFVNLFDALKDAGHEFALAPASRLLHAGGYKGRSREVDPDEFIEMARSLLGLARKRVINLLGMTELASQIYDHVSERDEEIERQSPMPRPPGARRAKHPPHWMRTLLFDPQHTEQNEGPFITAANRVGLLRHFDLANVERPFAIQTEDLGCRVDTGEDTDTKQAGRGGFEVLGRARSAEARGCSISLEEFYKMQSVQ